MKHDKIRWWMVVEHFVEDGPAEQRLALVGAPTPVDALAHVTDPFADGVVLAGLRVDQYSAVARLRTGREERVLAVENVGFVGTPWQCAVRDAA